MLRSTRSTPSSPANRMDVTVLQRQKDLLERLYHQSHSLLQNQETERRFDVHSAFHTHNIQATMAKNASTGNDHDQSYSVVSDSDCSSIGKAAALGRQCNSSSFASRGMNRASCSSADKRKAEFDIEEEDQENLVDADEAGEEKSEITIKTEREASSCKGSSKVSEIQKLDYIHVRARRGQATDSHSLAERARREKISKKMKCLQDLVPGCNKVTGKAGMLDEIINYVQSLQKQVEFLSMKLATINPRLDFTFSIDNFFAKEAAAYIGCLPPEATAVAQFEPTPSSCFHYNPMLPSNSAADIAVDPSLPQKSGTEAFLESSLTQLPGWEMDWTNLFNAGLHWPDKSLYMMHD